MELGPINLSRSVTSASTGVVSETLAPISERNIAPEQSPSNTTTRTISKPHVRDNGQYITQEQTFPDTTVKDEPLHERQSLLHSGPGKVLDWPKEAASLSPLTVTSTLALIWDITATLLPLLPIILAIEAAQLDNKPISEWGDRVVAATRLGPTVFPIIFAALVGRSAKSLARYLAERGTTVASLELLMGSQSVAGTIDTIWGLRTAKLVLGSMAFLLWSLSPLGGQSALRLVSTGHVYVHTAEELRYVNDGRLSCLFSSLTSACSNANVLYTTSLLSPLAIKNSTTDMWGNIKVPRLEAVEGNASQSLINVEYSNQTVYSSLLGLPIMGLQMDANSTFTVNTGYFALQCEPMVVRYPLSNYDDSVPPFQFHFPNGSWKDTNAVQAAKVSPLSREMQWFLDTYTPLGSNNVSALSNNTQLGLFSDPPNPAIRPFFPDITFASPMDLNSHWAVTNCSMSYIRVEANVSCTGFSCRIVSMRRLPLNDSRLGVLMDLTLNSGGDLQYNAFVNLCYNFPLATGPAYLHVNVATTPTERYLNGSEYPFSDKGDYYLNLPKVPLGVFSMRFPTLFNTFWQATIGTQYRTSNFSLADANEDALSMKQYNPYYNYYAPTLATDATFMRTHIVYKTQWTWFTLLLAASLVLQICAIAGLILKYLSISPDVLGFVSTMTRDNVYTPLPSAASTLGGHERARLLKDYRVRLADVKVGSQEGHVALCAVEGGVQFGKLSKRRRYD